MSTASKITDLHAREIMTAQFGDGNTMTIDDCAVLLHKHRNTILKWARASVENKRNGTNDPDDFPAFQNEPHSPYTIFFSDLKIWCNRKGMRF